MVRYLQFVIGVLVAIAVIVASEVKAEGTGSPIRVSNRAIECQRVEFEASIFNVELQIGIENGPDEYVFGDIRGIRSAEDKSIYVLDRAYNRVQVYNSKGVFERTVGREGEGPCEMAYPTALCVDSQKNIFIADQSRALVYDSAGLCDSDFSYEIDGGALPKSIEVDASGSIFITCYDMFQEKIIHKYNKNHKKTLSFCEPYSKGEDSDVRVQAMLAGGRIALDELGDVWFSQFMPYELRKYDTSGHLLMTIGRDNNFMRVPEKEVVGGGIRVPPAPFASGIFMLRNGGLLNVVTLPATYKDGPGIIVDIFDNQGKLVHSEQIDGDITVFSVDNESNVYFADEREFPRVIRARMKGFE